MTILEIPLVGKSPPAPPVERRLPEPKRTPPTPKPRTPPE